MSDRGSEVRKALEQAEQDGSPGRTFYGYVDYCDVRWLVDRVGELEEALRPFNRLYRDTGNPGAYVQIKVLTADLMRVRAALAKEGGGE